ncbi:Uncharacterized protein GBIM_11483 [Gryllus bimaculatus]|nr:Uncharacterized protein GBIM_11483 [Gryllus bimaculatus]
MGANSSKKATGRHPGLSDEEHRQLQKIFQVASKDSSHCTEMNIQELWNGINDRLLALLLNYYFKSKKAVDFENFIKPYVNVVHGTVDEKIEILTSFWETEGGIQTKDIIEYVYGVVHSFLQNLLNDETYESWKSAGCNSSDDRIRMFSNFLCHDLPLSPLISSEQLTVWVSSLSSLHAMEKAVFRNIYGTSTPDILCEINMPLCLGITPGTIFPSLLESSDILFLNSRLPKEMRCEWRFLFSTKIHGESFSKLLGNICNQGASLIIVKDKLGHVFGGFAPDSWNVGPSFLGNATSFLFKLEPSLNIYHPTCYNDHYQYLNIQQQTMPNGLGMGGQFEYFGLWLDAEFGTGHSSESCTTYRGYQMLSGEKNFQIDHVEVWAVGKPPVVEDEEQRSVLDDPKNWETKAMLEFAGRPQHSEGLREPVED